MTVNKGKKQIEQGSMQTARLAEQVSDDEDGQVSTGHGHRGFITMFMTAIIPSCYSPSSSSSYFFRKHVNM